MRLNDSQLRRITAHCYLWSVAITIVLVCFASVSFAAEYRWQSSWGVVARSDSPACMAVAAAFGSAAAAVLPGPISLVGCSADPMSAGQSVSWLDKNGVTQSVSVSAVELVDVGDVRTTSLQEILGAIGLVVCWGIGLLAGLQS